MARRGLALKALTQAAARPQEADKQRESAKLLFTEAARQFAAAGDEFAARTNKADNREATLRSRCNQVEMLLHIDKAVEARDLMAPLVKDTTLEKTRFHGLALYYHGWASFLLHDPMTAGRSLSQLAPYTDPAYGTHARFLLARVHQLSDERAEATGHYQGVLAEYDRQKKDAVQALRRPETFRNNPGEKARVEALVHEPPPEHVARSLFYLGVLQFEGGRFGDAQTHLAAFFKQFPRSPLAPAAQLRLGASQVESKLFAEAVKTLQTLDEQPAAAPLAEQTYYWRAKAWAGLIDPKNPQANPLAVQKALEAQRQAADKVRERAAVDPEARARLGQVMLDRSDLLLLVGQPREAGVTCRQLLTDKLLIGRQDEVLQRLAAALQLSGDYAESDKVCDQFLKEHAASGLLASVLFRHAENAAFLYLAAEKEPARMAELPRLNAETEKRYRRMLDRYPDFEFTGQVRFGLAWCLYRKGELEKAKEMLESIAPADHVDDLAVVPYLLTDWLIRLTPARADDALQAAKMQEHLAPLVPLLQNFVDANPQGPMAPDALFKLGLCKERLATIAATPAERNNNLGSAGRRFQRLIQSYPKDERGPAARLEMARCKSLAGDTNGAIGDLQRFIHDPILKATPVAPLAALELARLMRGQNQALEAANVLRDCRQQHEAMLLKDLKRVAWAAQLALQHGICLKEAGKPGEARDVLGTLLKQFPNRPEADEATLRIGQCQLDEPIKKSAAARRTLLTPTAKPEEIDAALRTVDEDMKALRAAVEHFESQADALKKKRPEAEVRARMLYDAAWGSRILAEVETAAARGKKEMPPAEKKARTLYQTLIADFGDLSLANDARLELAELLIGRGEHEAAGKLLEQTLDKEPPPELTDKVKLQLGVCRAAQGDLKAALDLFTGVIKNPKGPLFVAVHLWAGECLLRANDAKGAAKLLQQFRDQPPLRNQPGLSDRGLLCLAQAFVQLKQKDAARQTLERLLNDFGGSPVAAEARKELQALKDGMGLERRPLELPQFGQAVSDRASLEDVSGDLAQSIVLAATPVQAKKPVAYLRLAVSDPFEHRVTNRLEIAQAQDAAAPLAAWPAGNY
jgi:TolA-binding protein